MLTDAQLNAAVQAVNEQTLVQLVAMRRVRRGELIMTPAEAAICEQHFFWLRTTINQIDAEHRDRFAKAFEATDRMAGILRRWLPESAIRPADLIEIGELMDMLKELVAARGLQPATLDRQEVYIPEENRVQGHLQDMAGPGPRRDPSRRPPAVPQTLRLVSSNAFPFAGVRRADTPEGGAA